MSYQIIITQNEITSVFASRSDALNNLQGVAVPDDERGSLHEALLLHYLILAIDSKDTVDFKDHCTALAFLFNNLCAYKLWTDMYTEYAFISQQMFLSEQQSSKNIADFQPMRNVIGDMQNSSLYSCKLADITFDHLAITLPALIEKRQKQLQAGTEIETYDLPFIESSSHKVMYSRLGVTKAANTRSPEDYLKDNFTANASEKMLHVRQCEQIGCALDTRHVAHAKLFFKNLQRSILDCLFLSVPDKSQTIFYGGFASGLLLRDLQNIAAIIKAGYKNIKILLVDKNYADLIKLLNGEELTLDLKQQTELPILTKALNEFARWIADNSAASEDNPLKIHLFADGQEAENFMATQQQKLTVLVGQDYFVKDGCNKWITQGIATDDAHTDFIKLARVAANDGSIFELIKQHGIIYLQEAKISDNEYRPGSIVRYEKKEAYTTSYFFGQPLSELTGQPDVMPAARRRLG